MTGMDIRNEKRAAEGRSRLRVIPPVIVAPDRDIPGNNAKIWEIPIQMASSQSMLFKSRFLFPIFSANTNSAAVPNKKNAVTSGLLKADSIGSLNSSPIMLAGTVAMMIYQPNLA